MLLPAAKKLSVEAGIGMGWAKWVDASMWLERFGASAPGEAVYQHFGITAEAVAEAARSLLR